MIRRASEANAAGEAGRAPDAFFRTSLGSYREKDWDVWEWGLNRPILIFLPAPETRKPGTKKVSGFRKGSGDRI